MSDKSGSRELVTSDGSGSRELDAVKPGLEALKRYIKRSDRQYAWFFVGRTEILDEITEDCQRALEEIAEGEVFGGATYLIQGAPGAG